MNAAEIIKKLELLENPVNIAGMARFGITTKKAFGVSMPVLKEIAKDVKKQSKDRHSLALELWETRIHEARIIAYLIDDAKQVSEKQMESWAKDFDNWAICDGACGHLFCKTELAYKKVFEWSEKDEEFIKRGGIVLIAWLAVHDKKASDEKIAEFLPILEKHACDERNFIKKAVNWSLRQIGKRNLNLNKLAIEVAEKIKAQNTKSARWIAADALRELTNEKMLGRLQKKLKNSETNTKQPYPKQRIPLN
ncbi:MAG TPA: DNA alkylation repair protein [Pyrinomonadaceae bacterium]|nr:DNA alkylation repair protein [Pyrinomonadaceae bacterium]